MSRELKKAQSELVELEVKCAEYLAGWQRAQADYRNLEKETEKNRENIVKFAAADLLVEILPIYDNLKLALQHIPEDQKHADWVVGIKHIKNQFRHFLEKSGVEEIKTLGQVFDPAVHEAVKENDEDSLESEDNIIKKEIKSGYKLYGKVLYPAKVVV